MAEDPFEPIADLIPDGCHAVQSIRVVEYMTHEGGLQFHFDHEGEGPLSSTVGLLEMLKSSLIHDCLTEQDEDPPELGHGTSD